MPSLEELISRFKFEKLAKSDPSTKLIVLLGQIDSKAAIITLEKSHFTLEASNFNLDDILNELQLINHNDVYFWSNALLKQSIVKCPSAKLNLIYPATETHMRKYSPQAYHLIAETPKMYADYVKPYIDTMKGSRIKWVYNILFEGKESETFVYHDTDPESGFVLLPDMKWDKINLDSLYLTCIVNRTDISSIRDLNDSQVDFLINIRDRIRRITAQTYNIEEDEVRLFVHYQPSYYHFHIHVVNVMHTGLGDSIVAGRAILLDDIIENIQLVGDYYQRRNLYYVLGEDHDLWKVDGFKNSL